MKYSMVRGGNSGPSSTWRPWPMRVPFFIAFTALCILLCIAIELILRACSDDGCHVFGEMSTTKISNLSNFVYNLLPTAISVMIGLLWALPYHDVLRLEPYFQMSAVGGATAADSLFLDYPYSFTITIPFFAGKRRHYVVLLSSCILLIINFFVTPLISGIFDDKILQKQVSGTAAERTLYKDGSHRNTTEFAYQAYSYLWLEQPLPAFTTPTYALLPVTNPAEIRIDGNETWSAETTLFEADLSCSAALFNISRTNNTLGMSGSVISSRGEKVTFCNFLGYGNCDLDTTFVTPWTSLIKHLWDPEADPPSDKGLNRYMIGWARGTDPVLDPTPEPTQLPRDTTMLYCDVAFYSQPVVATFRAASGEVVGVDRTGSRELFVDTMGFNEAISGWPGINPDPPEYQDSVGNTVAFGYPRQALPSTKSHMRRQLGPCPDNALEYFLDTTDAATQTPVYFSDFYYSMIGLTHFALHNQTVDTLVQLLDAETLESVYERGFQLLFALWIANNMVDDSVTQPVDITRMVWARGFVVNKLWARGTQAGLTVVIVLVVLLGVLISHRHCELDGEPNSIAEGLRLLSGSVRLSAELENAEFHPPETVMKILDNNGRRYTLVLVPGKGPMIQVTDQVEAVQLTPIIQDYPHRFEIPTSVGLGLLDKEDPEPWIEKIWMLRSVTGIAIVIFYIAVIALLVTGFAYAREHVGLPTIYKTNSFGYKFLYSYLPLAVGMCIEPILVTLGVYHCMVGPYRALNRGNILGIGSMNRNNAPNIKALTTDYDKSPPQFQLIRSLSMGNIGMAVLSTAILLSNVLAVAFAGLFSPFTAEFKISTEIETPGGIKVNGSLLSPVQDINYILAGQLQGNIAAQDWTTPEYYVLPFYPVDRNLSSYEGTTFGIGTDVQCDLVPEEKISDKCYILEIKEYMKNGHVYHSQNYKNPCSPTDWDATGYADALYMARIDDACIEYEDKVYYYEEGLTWWWDQIAYDDYIRSFSCPSTFFAIWGNRPAVTHPRNGSLYQNTLDTAILKCKAIDKIVKLTARVEGEKVNATTDIQLLGESELAAIYTNSSEDMSLSNTFAAMMRSGIQAEMAGMSSLTGFPLTWINHLMVSLEPSIVQNLTNLTHVPNREILVETFEDVYRRLFAINLALYQDQVLTVGALQVEAEPATALITQERVAVSRLMFIISCAIVVFAVLVLVILYGLQSAELPGHAPTNLAAVYALLYASNAKEECAQLGQNPEERVKKLEELGGVYKLGEFEGRYGKRHFGVYRVDDDDMLTPLEVEERGKVEGSKTFRVGVVG